MTPIGELRASIPLGLITYSSPWFVVLTLSIVGNMIPVGFILLGLNTTGKWIGRFPPAIRKLITWREKQIRKLYGPMVRKYDTIALALLVAIPLPFTGAWTGALALWAFQMPLKRGVLAIFAGVCISGALVTSLVLAGIAGFNYV